MEFCVDNVEGKFKYISTVFDASDNKIKIIGVCITCSDYEYPCIFNLDTVAFDVRNFKRKEKC